MIVCSYLDELLLRILLAFLIERDGTKRLVEGFNAPLGTLSTRSAAAYALGLIQGVREATPHSQSFRP